MKVTLAGQKKKCIVRTLCYFFHSIINVFYILFYYPEKLVTKHHNSRVRRWYDIILNRVIKCLNVFAVAHAVRAFKKQKQKQKRYKECVYYE